MHGINCDRDTINVGWDGRIYDCDFNQQLDLVMGTAGTNVEASEKLRGLQVSVVDNLLCAEVFFCASSAV